MNLEEKTVSVAGVAFLAGFVLCYFLMGDSSPPAQKPLLTSHVFQKSGDLRTDVTYEIMRHKVEVRKTRTGPGARNLPVRLMEGNRYLEPWPKQQYKPDQGLYDLQYKLNIDVKELLSP